MALDHPRCQLLDHLRIHQRPPGQRFGLASEARAEEAREIEAIADALESYGVHVVRPPADK